MKQYYTVFAQAYGEGAYGACTYNNSTSCTSTSTTSSNSGVLTNTGFDILLIVTLACALIFTALVVRMARKSKQAKQTPVAEPIEIDDDHQPRQ